MVSKLRLSASWNTINNLVSTTFFYFTNLFSTFLSLPPPPLSIPLNAVSLSVRVFGVQAPEGTLQAHKTEIVCNFDLENDTLYTLNWFINDSEIASLRPSKQPVIEFFPLPSIELNTNQSFSNKLVINGFKSSGMYHVSCEVTVHDSFQMESASTNIRVIGLYVTSAFLPKLFSSL